MNEKRIGIIESWRASLFTRKAGKIAESLRLENDLREAAFALAKDGHWSLAELVSVMLEKREELGLEGSITDRSVNQALGGLKKTGYIAEYKIAGVRAPSPRRFTTLSPSK